MRPPAAEIRAPGAVIGGQMEGMPLHIRLFAMGLALLGLVFGLACVGFGAGLIGYSLRSLGRAFAGVGSW